MEEVYDMVQFARKCVLGDENIDDYSNLEYITKILQYLSIDAWLITRSNILLSPDESGKEHFVVFCFDRIQLNISIVQRILIVNL